MKTPKYRSGFTLVELMVVISIIGILSAVVYANLGGMGAKGRDAERQAGLRNLQIAIEKYKDKNGQYPDAGCSVAANVWATESTSCSNYIIGLEPDFIDRLPHDSKRGSGTGYSYMTNSANSVYKIAALQTVESETVTNTHKMKRCDTSGICGTAGVCSPADSRYRTTYALWGGFADGATDSAVRTATAATICR